jgi:subtilisin family serine protease
MTQASQPYLIHFRSQLGLERNFSINRLIGFNQKSAKPILDFLKSKNFTSQPTYLWIINSIKINATEKMIQELKEQNRFEESIESIELEKPKETNLIPTVSHPLPPQTKRWISWGVKKVQAPELWNDKTSGENVTIAMIDTGANIKHPDIQKQVWFNPGETGMDGFSHNKATNGIDDDGNGYVDDVYGYNFYDKNNNLEEVLPHGSQVAGILVGNGKSGIQTGVAPKARLMILKVWGAKTTVFESSIWEAMQYAITMKAKVVSMSLGVNHTENPSYAKWRRAGEVLLAANVLHVNAAGNSRMLPDLEAPWNICAPANNPPAWFADYQKQTSGMTSMISVGATNSEDVVQPYSSYGPSTWEHVPEYKDYLYSGGNKSGLAKPEVCAPSGVVTITSNIENYEGDYRSWVCD